MTAPAHVDRGGGYCDCGAQLCSFRECDGWCRHPGGWVEASELETIRAKNTVAQLKAAVVLPAGRWWCHDCQDFLGPSHFVTHGEEVR